MGYDFPNFSLLLATRCIKSTNFLINQKPNSNDSKHLQGRLQNRNAAHPPPPTHTLKVGLRQDGKNFFLLFALFFLFGNLFPQEFTLDGRLGIGSLPGSDDLRVQGDTRITGDLRVEGTSLVYGAVNSHGGFKHINLAGNFPFGQQLLIVNSDGAELLQTEADNKPNEQKTRVSIYPIPAEDIIYVELTTGIEGAFPLEIFSADGTLIMQFSVRQGMNVIDIHSLSSGLYLTRLKIEKEGNIIPNKFQKL